MKKIRAVRFLRLGMMVGLLFLFACSHVAPPALPPEAARQSVEQPAAKIPAAGAPAAPASPAAQQAGLAKPDPKVFVEDMLVSKGLGRAKVHALVSDPRVSISSGIVISNLYFAAPSGSAKNPKVMDVDPKWIGRGVTFIGEHDDAFDKAWERYRISPELITAILIIETNLGKYPMKYNVFKVYASLTSALDTEFLDEQLKAKGPKYKLTDDVLKQARTKGTWGLGELVALIKIADGLGVDPLSINGSFAGALGAAQFIPTSWAKYGVDGNGDGRTDPFDMDDCIASIANYMKLAGWKEEAKLEQKRQAIWIYNHHDVYVNTVMMLYDKLVAAGENVEAPEALPAAGPNGASPAQSQPQAGPAPADPAAKPQPAPSPAADGASSRTGQAPAPAEGKAAPAGTGDGAPGK